MRAVIQRVDSASVRIDGKVHDSIGKGFLVLVGIEDADTQEDAEWLAQKIVGLRVFEDAQGLMNINLQDAQGDLLVVSQFTLFASTKKGNRPSFIRSAKPDIAIPLYDSFVQTLGTLSGKTIHTGIFGADMQIELINNGPVTIWMDTKNKE